MTGLAEDEDGPQRLDPTKDPHYAIAEWDRYKLKRIAQALEAVGTLFAVANQQRNDPNADDIAAIFYTFGWAVKGVADASVFARPTMQ